MDVGMLFKHRGPATEKAQVTGLRFSDFKVSPQIADVPPLSMLTPQRSMILGSPAQHHEKTCRHDMTFDMTHSFETANFSMNL